MFWWQVLQGQPHLEASKECSGVTALLPHISSSSAATAVHFSPHESLQSEVAPCNDRSCHTNLGSDSDGVCVPAVMSQACVTSALSLSAFHCSCQQPTPALSVWLLPTPVALDTCKLQRHVLCAGGSETCTYHSSNTAWQILHLLP